MFSLLSLGVRTVEVPPTHLLQSFLEFPIPPPLLFCFWIPFSLFVNSRISFRSIFSFSFPFSLSVFLSHLSLFHKPKGLPLAVSDSLLPFSNTPVSSFQPRRNHWCFHNEAVMKIQRNAFQKGKNQNPQREIISKSQLKMS